MNLRTITTLGAILALAMTPAALFAASGDSAPAPTGSMAAATSGLNEALNVPGAPEVVSQTATSVTLKWAMVPTATSYIVKYSKTSVAEAYKAGKSAVYDIETDQITGTGTEIKDLKTDTSYYFAVVALDKDGNESATNSEELAVKLVATATAAPTATPAPVATSGTAATDAAASFKLASVTAANSKSLSLEFSAPVATASPVTLKITKTLDNSAIATSSVTVDPVDAKKVNVALASDLDASSSYSVTVISAKDANGASIKEGINAIKEFVTGANLAVAAAPTPVPTMNAAPPEMAATASGSVAVPAAQATTVPTGAKTNLLLVLAALVSIGIVYLARKSRA